MLNTVESVEDIHRLGDRRLYSQVNPNYSSTNIASLNHPKGSRPQFASFHPITPPSSLSGTPILEAKDSFAFLASHGSALNLNAVAHSAPTSPSSPKISPAALSTSSLLLKWAPKFDKEVTFLCVLWYGFSIVLANSTKAILLQFLYPVTLTQFQFVLNLTLCVALFAALLAFPSAVKAFPVGLVPNLQSLNFSVKKFLTPSAIIISTTLPMGLFQFVGHITSHKATSMIPVSLVHTIKALSPITTVLIYRVLYRIRFKTITYVTLLPLMLGIMLTCYRPMGSLKTTGYVSGLVYASISMLIFVLQNIFAKKRLTTKEDDGMQQGPELPTHTNKKSKKLDKLTILLFCSVIGFVVTMPVYIISEFRNDVFSLSAVTPYLMFLVVLNGVLHFLQSLLAFLLLGSISPVNYSIVNIMKRIAVIGFAFVWESSFSFNGAQAYGIVLTALGLYCYDRWGTSR